MKHHFIQYYVAIISLLLRSTYKIFHLFPVRNNRFLFISFGGRSITCNPYYIYEAIKERHQDYDLKWAYKDGVFPGYDTIKPGSMRYYYYAATSHYVISNNEIPITISKRKKQVFINTWHGGGAYKKVGLDLPGSSFQSLSPLLRIKYKLINKDTSYFISSSKKFTEVSKSSFHIDEDKFVNIGMPRNDMYFNKSLLTRNDYKVRKELGLNAEDYVILYAPTYRNHYETLENTLNVESLISAVSRKTGKHVVFLYRCHYNSFSLNVSQQNDAIIDVSKYQFMQELLCCSNMLISDYSSCIWDFSLTFKPCILYVPDLDKYEGVRDFYVPIEQWGFPIAKTNQELAKVIEAFDSSEIKKAMEHHHREYGSYERGTATQQLLELLGISIK